MKPSELRLGNKITSDGDIFIVDSISDSMVTAGALGIYSAGFIVEDYGIELTDEWLNKLGFKKRSETTFVRGHFDYSYVLEHRSVGKFKDGGYWMGIRYDDWDADPITVHKFAYLIDGIQYVHQLQNLWFALTCEEL